MKKPRATSTRIEDEELRSWLEQKAAKTAAQDKQQLKQEADLHRAARTLLMRDESTKT